MWEAYMKVMDYLGASLLVIGIILVIRDAVKKLKARHKLRMVKKI